MSDNLDQRLNQAKRRVRSKQKLESMLREAQDALEREQSRCSASQRVLATEEADVRKLEGANLTALFSSLLGTKDERLAKERQEVVAAKLKHEEAQVALKDARQEVERIEVELASLANADSEYGQLMEEKQRLLTSSGDEQAETLLGFSEKLADLQSDAKELQEAIQPGNAALRSLEQVRSKLGSAAGWGTWDLLGGGMITTMAKHSKIDSAKQHAHHAQRQLRRFQEELADADQRLHLSLEVGGFSKFADYFFDGLIADWVVQSKIRSASEACSSTIAQVSAAVNACKRQLAETEQGIKQLKRAKQEFIEEA